MWQEQLDLSGAELVCSPAVLAWPTLSVQLCDAADAALHYPADAIGIGVAASVGRSLGHLLGTTTPEARHLGRCGGSGIRSIGCAMQAHGVMVGVRLRPPGGAP